MQDEPKVSISLENKGDAYTILHSREGVLTGLGVYMILVGLLLSN